MKSLWYSFLFSAFASSAFAEGFFCASEAEFRRGDYEVVAWVEGEMRGARMEVGVVAYSIEMDGYDWAENSETDLVVMAKSNYQPRKYKNHMKFELGAKLALGGSISVIMPKRRSHKYRAYMIMTSISDHFGTTVPMDCRRT